jgi:hypothetical protein
MRRPGVRYPSDRSIESIDYDEALLALFVSGAKSLPKISTQTAKLNAEGRSLSEIAAALHKVPVPISEPVAQGNIYERTRSLGGPWR